MRLQVDVINEILILLTLLSEFATGCHVVRVKEACFVEARIDGVTHYRSGSIVPVDIEMASGSSDFDLFLDIRRNLLVKLCKRHGEVRLPS